MTYVMDLVFCWLLNDVILNYFIRLLLESHRIGAYSALNIYYESLGANVEDKCAPIKPWPGPSQFNSKSRLIWKSCRLFQKQAVPRCRFVWYATRHSPVSGASRSTSPPFTWRDGHTSASFVARHSVPRPLWADTRTITAPRTWISNETEKCDHDHE